MFHARDGLYFERLPDGSVKIMVRPVTGASFETILPPDAWASVLASTSARGETLDTWNEARQYHTRS